jgi:coenzyme F420-reducing hydrogenase beta subunit
MTENEMGVVIPKINKELCIDCGLCKKECPQNVQSNMIEPKSVYAAWAIDKKEQLSSSSGGAASVFYRQFIKNYSGVCVGSAFHEGLFLTHKIAGAQEEIVVFKGSKYVQSFVGNIFTQIEHYIKNSTPVLFIGTPCQVDGLKIFLGSDSEFLITVDLICHGTPPVSYLQEHFKDYITKDPKLIVGFRTNNQFRMILYSYAGLKATRRSDIYLYAFLKCLIYRESCYHCKYAQVNRVGDITIGDFWGLPNEVASQKDAQDGCSAVLINTEKGNKLFDMCKSEMIFFKRALDEVRKYNKQLNHPSIPFKNRRIFIKYYIKAGFDLACYIALFPYYQLSMLRNFLGNIYRHIFGMKQRN